MITWLNGENQFILVGTFLWVTQFLVLVKIKSSSLQVAAREHATKSHELIDQLHELELRPLGPVETASAMMEDVSEDEVWK